MNFKQIKLTENFKSTGTGSKRASPDVVSPVTTKKNKFIKNGDSILVLVRSLANGLQTFNILHDTELTLLQLKTICLVGNNGGILHSQKTMSKEEYEVELNSFLELIRPDTGDLYRYHYVKNKTVTNFNYVQNVFIIYLDHGLDETSEIIEEKNENKSKEDNVMCVWKNEA